MPTEVLASLYDLMHGVLGDYETITNVLEKKNTIENYIYKLMYENIFLAKREKKLQLIEQIYKNQPVDLQKLSEVVKDD